MFSFPNWNLSSLFNSRDVALMKSDSGIPFENKIKFHTVVWAHCRLLGRHENWWFRWICSNSLQLKTLILVLRCFSSSFSILLKSQSAISFRYVMDLLSSSMINSVFFSSTSLVASSRVLISLNLPIHCLYVDACDGEWIWLFEGFWSSGWMSSLVLETVWLIRGSYLPWWKETLCLLEPFLVLVLDAKWLVLMIDAYL